MKLDTCISGLRSLNDELKIIGRMLISNKQGGSFVCLEVAPGQSQHMRNLSAFVIHSAIVFSSSKGAHMILTPFSNILQNPAMLKVLYYNNNYHDKL